MDKNNVLDALETYVQEQMEAAYAAGIEQGKESAQIGPNTQQVAEALQHAFALGCTHVIEQMRDHTINVEDSTDIYCSGGLSGQIYFEQEVDIDDHMDFDDFSSEISAEQIAECTEAFAPKTENDSQPQTT